MPPNSSISSSEARRYLLLALAALVAVVLLAASASFVGIRQGLVTWKEARLLHYQLDKLDAAPRIDVLLVGDSTLGNAVDAGAWSRALGRSVLALPLTGTYGYEGTLNMIRRALRRHRPALVVLFQSVDMMTRPRAFEGLLYTAETPGDLLGIPPWRLVRALANLDVPASMVQNLVAGGAGRAEVGHELSSLGYIAQRDPPPSRRHILDDAEWLEPAMIRPEKAAVLDRIGRLCRQAGIPCLYAHGPYVLPACAALGPYLDAVRALIGRAGLRLVPGTPVCMPLDEAGDTADHVAPARKAAYSARYLDLVRAAAPALADPGPGAAGRR